MAELPENARRVRKRIMDQALRDGTVPAIAELSRDLSLSYAELSANLKDLEAAMCVARQDQAHAGLRQFQDEPLGTTTAGCRRDRLRPPVRRV